MTAPSHPDRQGTREELAAALDAAHRSDVRPRWIESGQRLDFGPIADALLPVVERLCDQRAAEALEEAAAEVENSGAITVPLWHLRNRVAALKAQP